jgi:hypothetical protein
MNDIIAYALYDFSDSDMVGLTIRNDENMSDRALGISFRRNDQLSAEAIRSVLENFSQSNAIFNVLDRLVIQLHAVRVPSG